MPFTSKAQAKFLFAVKPEIAKEFARKTMSIKKLPEHVRKRSKKIMAGHKNHGKGKRK